MTYITLIGGMLYIGGRNLILGDGGDIVFCLNFAYEDDDTLEKLTQTILPNIILTGILLLLY